VQTAIDPFDLHVLGNNAGILRDQAVVNMTEAAGDASDPGAPRGSLLPDEDGSRVLPRTRLTEATPGLVDVVTAPEDAGQFDLWDPANVSPFVAYPATAKCPFNGETFLVQGGVVQRCKTVVVVREDRPGRPVDRGRARRRGPEAEAPKLTPG
jgi:hypothetical protein